MRENPQLVKELKEMIVEHFHRSGHEDFHLLSKECGVGISTIRRIVSEKTKTEPMASTVLGIVSGISGEKNIQKIVGQYSGEIGKKLRASYESIVGHTDYVPEFSSILSDRIAYIIYKLASSRRGTTKENLKKLMGIPSLETIKDLINVGLIYYGDDSRIYSTNRSFALPEQIIKKHISEMVRFSNYGSQYTNDSSFYSLSESVNPEAYEEILSTLSTAVKKIREIIRKEESVGDIPFFFTSILDTIDVSEDHNN